MYICLLQGVRSLTLHFTLRNTSVTKIPREIFLNSGWARNISIGLYDNNQLQQLGNPSTGGRPNLPSKLFLVDLRMRKNKWSCDCNLG